MTCIHCGAEIEKVRVDRSVALRAFMWRTVAGKQFYCPKSDGWHSPGESAGSLSDQEGKKR